MIFSLSSCSQCSDTASYPKDCNMADKISDENTIPTDKAVLDNSAMDSEKQVLRTKDADAALEFLYAEETTIMTDADEKKLVRKIDWRIVPLMCESSDAKTPE